MAKILNAVSQFIVVDNGSVDWDSTLGAIQNALETEIRENAESDSLISQAVNQVFDQVPAGTGIDTPTVIHTAASILSGGNFQKAQEWKLKVSDFLERSANFVSKRGRSGGLFRIG